MEDDESSEFIEEEEQEPVVSNNLNPLFPHPDNYPEQIDPNEYFNQSNQSNFPEMSVDIATHLIQNTSTPQQSVSTYRPFENATPANNMFSQKSPHPPSQISAQKEDDSDDDIEIIDEVVKNNDNENNFQASYSDENPTENEYSADSRHNYNEVEENHTSDSEESEGEEDSQQLSEEENDEIHDASEEISSHQFSRKSYGGKTFTPANVDNREYNDEDENEYSSEEYEDEVLDEDDEEYNHPHNAYSGKTVSSSHYNLDDYHNSSNLDSDKESISEKEEAISHHSDNSGSSSYESESVYTDENNEVDQNTEDNEINEVNEGSDDDEDSNIAESDRVDISIGISHESDSHKNTTSQNKNLETDQHLEHDSSDSSSLTQIAQMAMQHAFPEHESNISKDNLQTNDINTSASEDSNRPDSSHLKQATPQKVFNDVEEQKPEPIVGVGLNGTPIKTLQFGGFKISNVGTPDTSVTFTFGQSFRSPSPELQQNSSSKSVEDIESESQNVLPKNIMEDENEAQKPTSSLLDYEVVSEPSKNVEKAEEVHTDNKYNISESETESKKTNEAEKQAPFSFSFSNRTWFAPKSQIDVGYSFGQSVASSQSPAELQPQPLPIEKEISSTVAQLQTKKSTDGPDFLGKIIFCYTF